MTFRLWRCFGINTQNLPAPLSRWWLCPRFFVWTTLANSTIDLHISDMRAHIKAIFIKMMATMMTKEESYLPPIKCFRSFKSLFWNFILLKQVKIFVIFWYHKYPARYLVCAGQVQEGGSGAMRFQWRQSDASPQERGSHGIGQMYHQTYQNISSMPISVVIIRIFVYSLK